MKKIISGLLLLGALIAAAAPVINWPSADAARADFYRIGADGSMAKASPAAPFTLDGKSLLAVAFRPVGAQTIRVRIQYAARPAGAIVSRHRPQEKLRGIELGLASKNFFTLDGAKPAAQVSSGTRDTIASFFDAAAPELRPEVWYETVLVFTPGDRLEIYIIEPDTGKIVLRRSVDCPKAAALPPGAGGNLLCLGGRRNNSKDCDSFAPAGTRIGAVTVWDKALDEEELGRFLGLSLSGTGAVLNPAPRRYFVNAATGRDDADGLRPDAAFRTIQRAADLVNPGDEVSVAAGIYYETVQFRRGGNEEQPIVFRAEGEPGSVTVTAATRELRERKAAWTLEDAARQIYSTPFRHNPSRVLCGEIDLFPYTTRAGLETFLLKAGYPAPENGFYFDEKAGKLLVRLPNRGDAASRNPAAYAIAAAPVFAPGSNGNHIYQAKDANFYVAEKKPMHLIFDGFLFETPGSAGVVTGGSNIVVRNSIFKGCRGGVWGFADASAVFVENSRYDQLGAYDDVLDTIRKWGKTDIPKQHIFYFWARKGVNCDTTKMKNYETGIVGGVARNWHVRNNLVVDSFEGMSCWCVDWAKSFQIYGNTFRRIVDNAIETENHAADVRIYNNVFEDVFEPISWQPLGGKPWPGPVYVYRNIFRSTPEFKLLAEALNPAQFRPGLFKLGVAGRNWQHSHMGNLPVEQIAARESKRFVAVPDPGFLTFNNTMLWPEGNLLTTPQPMQGRAARELVNFRWFNNIFAIPGLIKITEWRGGLMEFYHNLEVGKVNVPEQRNIMAGDGGFTLPDLAAVGFVNSAQGDFALRPDSPARGRGTLDFEEPDASTDLGAVPFGTVFATRCGPGTAVDTARLSPFAQRVHYQPTLIRTAGPEPGRWGVYSLDNPETVNFRAAANLLRMVFRVTEKNADFKLLRNGKFSVSLQVADGKTTIVVADGGNRRSAVAGILPRDRWQTLELNFAPGFTGRLNGKELIFDEASSALRLPPQGTWQATVGRNPVYDIWTEK